LTKSAAPEVAWRKEPPMSQPKTEFEYESLEDPQSIGRYLSALADGFAKGVLAFSDRRGEIALEPRGLVEFEVRVSKKRDRSRLSLSFTWRPARESSTESGPLSITADSE
jgi:amphi-Trp domain-containing protein